MTASEAKVLAVLRGQERLPLKDGSILAIPFGDHDGDQEEAEGKGGERGGAACGTSTSILGRNGAASLLTPTTLEHQMSSNQQHQSSQHRKSINSIVASSNSESVDDFLLSLEREFHARASLDPISPSGGRSVTPRSKKRNKEAKAKAVAAGAGSSSSSITSISSKSTHMHQQQQHQQQEQQIGIFATSSNISSNNHDANSNTKHDSSADHNADVGQEPGSPIDSTPPPPHHLTHLTSLSPMVHGSKSSHTNSATSPHSHDSHRHRRSEKSPLMRPKHLRRLSCM
jgi:hypothetical protein